MINIVLNIISIIHKLSISFHEIVFFLISLQMTLLFIPIVKY